MRIRAAVLEEFGAAPRRPGRRPGGPGAGRGARAAARLRGLPHRPVHRVGRRPVGLRADRAGPRGRRRRRGRRRGRDRASPRATTWSRCSRPSAASASTAARPKTNLCLAIREQQNKGYLPDGTTRLSRDGEPIRHFMGTIDVRRGDGDARDRAGQGHARGAAGAAACLFACGLTTGLGAAMYTAKVEAGSTCVVFGAGMVGLGAVAGARLQGAERIVCVDMSDDRLELAAARAPPTSWRAARTRPSAILEMTGGFGADYTFESTGLGRRDAPGGRDRAHGLGAVHGDAAWPARARRWTSSRAS